MALCDLCNTPGMGTIVAARDMSNAVRKGFDHYKEGLLNIGLAHALVPDAWRQSAISGQLSMSDWNVCSRCMTKLKPYLDQSSSCFIATACYGSFTCSEVLRLRYFRDQKLLHSHLGKLFVTLYYSISPNIAGILCEHPRFGVFIRICILAPVLWVIDRWR